MTSISVSGWLNRKKHLISSNALIIYLDQESTHPYSLLLHQVKGDFEQILSPYELINVYNSNFIISLDSHASSNDCPYLLTNTVKCMERYTKAHLADMKKKYLPLSLRPKTKFQCYFSTQFLRRRKTVMKRIDLHRGRFGKKRSRIASFLESRANQEEMLGIQCHFSRGSDSFAYSRIQNRL